MREPAFYVCENKGPHQLSGSRTAEHRLSFRYIDNTNTLLYESEISNLGQSALSVSVLVGDLEQRFSHDAAQICSIFGDEPNGWTSVVFSLLEGEMSRIWYQNDQ